MNNESKMRVACVYINAGKGHYIPAKAIGDALHAIGVEAVMVDYFSLLGAKRFDAFNQRVWRVQLRFPLIERIVNRGADHSRFIPGCCPSLSGSSLGGTSRHILKKSTGTR